MAVGVREDVHDHVHSAQLHGLGMQRCGSAGWCPGMERLGWSGLEKIRGSGGAPGKNSQVGGELKDRCDSSVSCSKLPHLRNVFQQRHKILVSHSKRHIRTVSMSQFSLMPM
jgi:hypothetical protein